MWSFGRIEIQQSLAELNVRSKLKDETGIPRRLPMAPTWCKTKTGTKRTINITPGSTERPW